MDDERWPPQHSQYEQQRIMRDLQVSIHQAQSEGDEERVRNLETINY